ncbi:hypothetical protein [Streptomyces sp. BRA346]|uniref:hypothetical protein n=1 Tax=Streptomyces sp. BRA346 TaxID=2878199 RepID=UPI0040635C38
MEITDLTPAERRVWRAFPLDEGVDFREGADDDPEHGGSWGPERTIRAEVLRALLLGGPTRDGEVAGLKLTGARITGELRLKYGVVEHAIRLRSCHFERTPQLYGARLGVLVFSDSTLPELTAGALHTEGVLRMSRCRTTGPVRLAGAQITGGLFLDGARLGTPDTRCEQPLLQLNNAAIGADVRAEGLIAHGMIRLNEATVTGQVNLDDSELHAPGGIALHAENLSVGNDLHAKRLRARGHVNLSGARMPRHLNLA